MPRRVAPRRTRAPDRNAPRRPIDERAQSLAFGAFVLGIAVGLLIAYLNIDEVIAIIRTFFFGNNNAVFVAAIFIRNNHVLSHIH